MSWSRELTLCLTWRSPSAAMIGTPKSEYWNSLAFDEFAPPPRQLQLNPIYRCYECYKRVSTRTGGTKSFCSCLTLFFIRRRGLCFAEEQMGSSVVIHLHGTAIWIGPSSSKQEHFFTPKIEYVFSVSLFTVKTWFRAAFAPPITSELIVFYWTYPLATAFIVALNRFCAVAFCLTWRVHCQCVLYMILTAAYW